MCFQKRLEKSAELIKSIIRLLPSKKSTRMFPRAGQSPTPWVLSPLSVLSSLLGVNWGGKCTGRISHRKKRRFLFPL